jgi:error-prone DNA polymerase
MVLTHRPLCELVPIENAAMPGRTVIQWDKDDLDALGILKVDCLSLGMLTAIRKCFDLIEKQEGRRWTLATIPPEDPAVYTMVQKADTIGVFQIESRAQMAMLPRLAPRSFYDLVVEVAIVRPGPIQGNMVHPYLRRRCGIEPVDFPSEAVREVLEKTLGVPIFQEQAMRLAVVAAGFSPGEADQLRRAMAAWRRPGVIDQFREKLIAGMLSRGYAADFAERVYLQIRGFGEYGFPESHAASFALLAYASAWLKRYYPAAFAAALINSQPMGFYAPAQLVIDAQKHGVCVRAVDVNASEWDCTLEGEIENCKLKNANCKLEEGDVSKSTSICNSQFSIFNLQSPPLRLGLRLISGLSEAHARRIVAARAAGPFRSVDDLRRRAKLSSAVLSRLARAGAFGSLCASRRQAAWQSLLEYHDQPLFARLEESEPAVALPEMSAYQEVVADYGTAGLSLRNHPMSFLREKLQAKGVVTSADLVAGVERGLPARRVGTAHHPAESGAPHPPSSRRSRKGGWCPPYKVAGLVLLRQRPGTAKGITFVTLEDETGTTNLVVHQRVWEKYHRVARGAVAMLATGQLQKRYGVVHLVVEKLEDLTESLREVGSRSRDFR